MIIIIISVSSGYFDLVWINRMQNK
jgi:hypothetical protein